MGNNLFGAAVPGRYGDEQESAGIRGGPSEAAVATSVSHKSTYEFKQFVVNEFFKSSNAIGDKFTEFMNLRDIEFAKLEEEVKKLRHLEEENKQAKDNSEDVIVRLSCELQSRKQLIEEQAKKLESYEKNEIALKKELEAKNEEILKLNKLIDPMRQLRRRGHCIQSGDTTHEDVARDYMQLFVQRNSLESIRKKEAGQRASELKKILEIAYSACKNHVIEIAKNELAMLFKPPVRVLTELERKNEDIYLPWQSRQEALSLLLSNSKIRNQCVPDDLTDEVIKELSKQCEYHSAGMHTVLKQVAELTWKMVNLSPPVSLGYLPFSEDLDLYDVTDVKDLLGAEEKYKVEYRRPILFFGSSGIVGSKGSIAIYPFAEHSKLDGAGMLPDDKITSDNTPTFDLSENKEKNESNIGKSMMHNVNKNR
uniref:Uncharacterized protein n=1 Tax=Amphimedon queenslandica TaxID=400682 RepID=A0A1X7TJ72_AMPQE